MSTNNDIDYSFHLIKSQANKIFVDIYNIN